MYLGRDNNIYLNAIQQASWDDKNRSGSFQENAKSKDKSISVKLNEFEAGGIIHAIDSMSDWSAYHSFEDNKTQISLKVWEKKDKDKKPTGERAFGLSITRNSVDTFKLPVELSEAQVIKQFLTYCLFKKFASNAQKKKDTGSQQ